MFVCIYPCLNAARCETLNLGALTFATSGTTARGAPVIPMWKAQTPSRKNAAGFPILKTAQHYFVWQPELRADGGYNHYACLFYYNGRFYAMWGNHPEGEDAPGQRVLFASSSDARAWTPAAELFPPPGPVLKADKQGIHLKPDRWVTADGKLYAVVYVCGAGASNYPIAREVAGDGTLGAPFLLRALPAKGKATAALPSFMPAPRKDPALAEKINQWYKDNDTISWWARSAGELSLNSIDDAALIESFAYRSKDGMVVLMRDYTKKEGRPRSNRIYAFFADGKGGWSRGYPTDIPDSGSRAQAFRLPDGRVLLVGNQIAYKFDTGLRMSRDPLTLAVSPDGEFFTKVYALRWGGSNPPKYRFSKITGRSLGYGYPSMIVQGGMIYVLYSINKEDMAITSVPLDSIK